MPSKLMDYFNKSPRIGTMSTSDKTGNVDSALFGSPRMTDGKTVVMGLGKNRTLANLQQNPHAVYPDHGTGEKPHGLEGGPGLPGGKEHCNIRAGA